MNYVIKRDGRSVPFNKNKIVDAITSAMKRTPFMDMVLANYIADKISMIESDSTVEQIQDMVEHYLMNSDRKDVAKEYIVYRNDRSRERSKRSDLMKTVGQKLTASNVQNSNANIDQRSFGGRRGQVANEILRQHALNNLMSPLARDNHLNNEIYTHDLDSWSLGQHNCLTIPFDDLLANGFNTRQVDIRPANSINTAFQLLAVIFQIQSLQEFGGCSASHLDHTMVPYVRKSFSKHYDDARKYIRKLPPLFMGRDMPIDSAVYKEDEDVYKYAMDMTERELNQAVEGMYHNLNSLQSRSGNQLPFSSINYGTCTLPQGRMVIKALLEGSIKGVGKHHRTSIFPCGIFQCMSGVNRKPGDPNYDMFRLALESTAKRLYPNYANVDWSGNAGYDRNDPRTYFATMGCRTANGFDINGFGQLKDGRGNICPVTIIMPTLAMEAKDDLDDGGEAYWIYEKNLIEKFMKILDKKIHEAKDILIERFNYICSQSPDSAKFMYENRVMAGYIPEEGIRSALKHGTLAIGQLGLAETLQILIGKNHTTPEGMELAKKIEQLFKDRCSEFKEKYKLNFGVYYTPAENLSYTAMKKFKAKYGVIQNVSDREYFTNSIHVPVWQEIDVFEKIDVESQLTGYSSAGCITYIECDSSVIKNIDAIETFVNYAMDKDIPYFAINVPNDTCMDCGYIGEFNNKCPECGSENIQQLRRVTGYLSTDYHHFNLGKQAQVKDRFQHTSIMR